jgi:hypothetical protein
VAQVGRPRTWYFITCPWCVSVWAGAVVVVLTKYLPTGWQWIALALAFSAVAGLISLVAS